MDRVNVAEIKGKLSEYLDRVARGERIVICRHNKPVAELRPIGSVRRAPRPIGPLAGRPRFDVAPSFFEAVSDSDADAWEAPLQGIPSVTRERRAPAVTEQKGRYGSGRRRRIPRRQS
jgi:prevent-host-death family protein